MAELLPLFVSLKGRRVLLVGGGPVAASKLATLHDAGADVHVIAPVICDAIRVPGVSITERAVVESDLDDVWLVVAAATPEVNRAVARAAEVRRIFVNAVDDPDNASAYLGGVLRRQGVTLAISTEGHAPALTGLLREALEAVLPQDLDRWLALARRLRPGWKGAGVPIAERRPLLLAALNELYDARSTGMSRESEAR